MFLCGFPEESLIHCWFGLFLCCVSASEQCVKTGYLPRSVGERTGQAPKGLDKHHVTSQPIFSPSVSLSFPFDVFCICLFFFLNSTAFFFTLSIQSLPLFSLPTAPALLCPLFLCLSLFQHNAFLWKRLKHVLFGCHPTPAFFCGLQKNCGYLVLVIISCRE